MVKSSLKNLSFGVDEFLHALADKGASFSTLKNYRRYLNEFIKFAQAKKIEKIIFDDALINRYHLHLSRKRVKKTTKNYFLIALRSFLLFLNQKKVTKLDPKSIRLYSHQYPPRETISSNDLTRLFSSISSKNISDLRDRVILETLSTVKISLQNLVKLNRDQKLFNTPSLQNYLFARKDNYKPLFIRFRGKVDARSNGEKMRLTGRSIERMVKKYTQKAKLKTSATPVLLRQSFVN